MNLKRLGVQLYGRSTTNLLIYIIRIVPMSLVYFPLKLGQVYENFLGKTTFKVAKIQKKKGDKQYNTILFTPKTNFKK